jgi:DNA-binding transcriptional regulator YhcF (GntR family)
MRTLPSIDSESRVPKQVQVRQILASAIAGGLFAPGSRMPDPRQIATEVNTGLATVRRAVVFLVKHGWLERDAFGHTVVRRKTEHAGKYGQEPHVAACPMLDGGRCLGADHLAAKSHERGFSHREHRRSAGHDLLLRFALE